MTGNGLIDSSAEAQKPTLGLPLSNHSRYAQRVRRRFAPQLSCLAPGPPNAQAMALAYASLMTPGDGTNVTPAVALRILRHLVLERCLTLDCERDAPLDLITQAMTTLAEFALDVAHQHALQTLDALHGAPLAPGGARARLWVLGMGKLGARELNVSSDIDLIFVYDHDGHTEGGAQQRNKISNAEYFAKAVRTVASTIGETTEHGFVFRVDLALRPNGNSGPAATSLGALENYFFVQGREWERFAWLKSRVVAPKVHQRDGSILGLRAIVTAFVFRRYLDYSVFDALRALHRQIREHAARRSAGRPERSNDVKLSRGGIREIEFTVQLLQVVRGGQFPELRTRPTLDALQRLAQAGLMPSATAQALAQAYVFLRRVEHRIQYLDDAQTHVLPTSDADLAWMAQTLRLGSTEAFLTQLDLHRDVVAQEFDRLLGGASQSDSNDNGNARNAASSDGSALPDNGNGGGGDGVDANADFDELLAQLPPALQARLSPWREHPRVLALRETARQRLLRLLWRTSHWLAQSRITEVAMLRLVDWMEPLLRRENYLALLLERPAVHERLVRLLGEARWLAHYLLQHPGVIDELAGIDLLRERFVASEFEAELELRRSALRASGDDDEEALLNVLRRAHHAEVFRTLARDVEGKLTVEQAADDLSALADAVLTISMRWCWQRLKNKHREQPQFAIIAYGKLGGLELGYGSDLDLVFVFDDEHEAAPEVYGRLVRKLIHSLTVKTAEGDLYEIDTALRPNGNAGLLVSRWSAYADYQLQRGSNTAWTWEHQAMTRARCVLGSAELRARFAAMRQSVVAAPREAQALAREIIAMRGKVRAAHPTRDEQFDLKYSAGGMMDVEFAVQYLVLAKAAQHPALAANVGNIALLHLAQAAQLLPAGVGDAAADAYREMRRLQHRARLDEQPTQLAANALVKERAAVAALSRAVFAIY